MRTSTLSDTSEVDNDAHILPIITDEDWPIQVYDGDIEADLCRFDSVQMAETIFGGLSHTSKMPGPSFNLPASACPTGSKLREILGSPCSVCYAADTYEWRKKSAKILGTRYKLSNFIGDAVRRANSLRLHCLRDPLWVPALTYVLLCGDNGREIDWMRWFSSGDVQSPAHLQNVMSVVRATPETRHWMPTMEHSMAKDVVPPKNMAIRVSGTKINGPPPSGFSCFSTISTGDEPAYGGFRCPAAKAVEFTCGNCRACWDHAVGHVDYHEKQFAALARERF